MCWLHVGLTTGGMIGASDRRTVGSLVPVLEEICGVADAAGRFIPVLCHGGPISEPANLEEALRLVPRLNGFVGASSIERLPTESAIVDRIARFRAVSQERSLADELIKERRWEAAQEGAG